MKVLSIGAGAIGSYIAASLGAQSHTIVILERSANIPLLSAGGLHLTVNNAQIHVEGVHAVDTLEAAMVHGPFDLALFALKSYDTETALEGMRPHLKEIPPILCLQNGVENEPRIAAVLGGGKVIPATVTTAVARLGTGRVAVERLRGIGIAGSHPLVPAILTAFENAGLNPRHYPDADAMKWSKLLTNLVSNATSAVLELPPRQVYSHYGLFRLEMAMLREALAVMRGLGLDVVNLPRTPVQALAFAASRLPTRLSQPLLIRAIGKGRGEKMPSLYLDLQSGGRESEVSSLNGAVVSAAQALGIPAPVNRLLTSLLLELVWNPDRRAEFTANPAALLARL
ncbi:MAG: ketopantoate reductase family protein [Chloroflexi bacterium]|nr:ketopantoate reductase family protein [Chloroflexota bacterium]